MTVTDVAKFLHVHRITIYRLIRGGELHPFKVGRLWRFNRRDILAVAENRAGTRNAESDPFLLTQRS